MEIGIAFHFEKADTTGRFVRGWASVVSENGTPVVDHQGDIVGIDELRKAAHKFICDHRVAKAMHNGVSVGEVVESVIIDDAFAKALDIADSKRGWWIGMEITNPSVQEKVRKGVYRAFSIGGRGRRIPMENT